MTYHKPSRTNFTLYFVIVTFMAILYVASLQTKLVFALQEKTIQFLLVLFSLLWAGFVLGVCKNSTDFNSSNS
jgi:hypothetical protein